MLSHETDPLMVMWIDCQSSGHKICNQGWVLVKAPQPNVLAASEKTLPEVDVTGKNDVPFQSCRNTFHHIKSARVPTDIVVGSSAT